MSRAILISCMLTLCGCGVQGPLLRPKDIPEWERKRQEKLEERRIEPEAMLHITGAA